MVVLVMPEGCGFENEDVGCSWDALAYRQRAGFLGDLTKAAVEEGDTLAMQDRNCITEEFERKVFVHVVDDESAFIFHTVGSPLANGPVLSQWPPDAILSVPPPTRAE